MRINELPEYFDGVSATRFDKVFVASIKPHRQARVWYIILGDELGEYAASTTTYRTKTEALADLPPVVSNYYGIAA